ncbi:MAG: NAD(P)-dependent oxidoreductase, partial [Nitrospirae bacterium]|nr:NAD(P)-dependent oxidoreductase [Nitrospirota bacterium]
MFQKQGRELSEKFSKETSPRFGAVNFLYYPAFIDLRGKQCVVVGGGKVAERKALALLRSGALVRVISPVITGVLEKHKKKGRIEHIERTYKKGDLKGTFLVIAATSDDRINAEISNHAQ